MTTATNPTPGASLEAIAPVPAPLPPIPQLGWFSDFVFDEAIGALGAGSPRVAINVPSALPKRKLYAYIFADVTNGAAYSEVLAEVVCLRRDAPVASFPLTTATSPVGDLTLKRSLPSCFVSAAVDGQNAIIISLAAAIAGEVSPAVIQAMALEGEIDRVTIILKKITNSTNIRLCLGCISSL